MGSGESAETTDSKLNNTRKLMEKPVQPSSTCINEEAEEDGDGDVPDAGDESDTNDDWMFQTFSKGKNKKLNKKKVDAKAKAVFDPFSGVSKDIKDDKEEANISSSSDEEHDPKCDDSDDDDLMGGGLQLMG